jgi:hypothetical protein
MNYRNSFEPSPSPDRTNRPFFALPTFDPHPSTLPEHCKVRQFLSSFVSPTSARLGQQLLSFAKFPRNVGNGEGGYSLANTSNSVLTTPLPLSPFPVTLTSDQAISAKSSPLSPLDAFLTDAPSRKSFPCRSYEKQGGKRGTLFPVSLRKLFCLTAVFFCFACLPAQAQNVQFLPEIDAHLKLNSTFRTYLEAKDDQDGGDSQQFAIGPSVQFYLKPLIKLKDFTRFDLNDSKTRAIVLETGYRYITAPSAAPENRMIAAATLNFPLNAGFLVTDRNRADLDWKSGDFSWRYRNKLTVERTFSSHSYHFIPYIAAEPYYESKYSKWSTTALYAGCLFPVGRHVEFNTYYEHENNTGKHPNQQTNSVGLALYLYFSLEKN